MDQYLPNKLQQRTELLHQQLAEVRGELRKLNEEFSDTASAICGEVTPEGINKLLRARRARSAFFRAELFADPAWDILLEALAAQLSQHRISASDISANSGIPNSTVVRWIAALEKEGLVARVDDRFDGRRSWITLTPEAYSTMQRYFAAVARVS